MKNAIETENLTKVYSNNFTAVNSLNLEIPNKTIFGMLGPNGAGKTTTIKMLTCLIQPTSGRATVGGFDVQNNPDEVRNLLGMVPQQVSLYSDLTVMENSQLLANCPVVKSKKLPLWQVWFIGRTYCFWMNLQLVLIQLQNVYCGI